MKSVRELSQQELIDKKYIINLRGTMYQSVAYRTALFREDHPDWTIETKERNRYEKTLVVACIIKDENDRVRSYAEAEELFSSRFPTIEKASTDALGRALAYLGYATAQLASADEMEKVTDYQHRGNGNNGNTIANKNRNGSHSPHNSPHSKQQQQNRKTKQPEKPKASPEELQQTYYNSWDKWKNAQFPFEIENVLDNGSTEKIRPTWEDFRCIKRIKSRDKKNADGTAVQGKIHSTRGYLHCLENYDNAKYPSLKYQVRAALAIFKAAEEAK